MPNALSLLRIVAAPALPLLAATGSRWSVIALFLALAMSDWLDGKLASLLDQRSAVGPRLDSLADAVLYGALLIALLLVETERLLREWPWVAAVLASYALSGLAAWWKLGRWPSYHTRTAKLSWLLVTVGVLVFLAGWGLWPLRLALAVVVAGNLETLVITWLLPAWHADVKSIRAALRIRRRELASGGGGPR